MKEEFGALLTKKFDLERRVKNELKKVDLSEENKIDVLSKIIDKLKGGR